MILTHKVIALDEHGEDPKVMAVLDSEEHAQRVADSYNYMCEMMPSLNDCVDWVCDRFALDATDELIDFVADCHDEFFGN